MKDVKILSKLVLIFAAWVSSYAAPDVPEWWRERGLCGADVSHTSLSVREDSMAAANAGQLKNIALKAAEEMNEKLGDIGGAGDAVNNMVDAFGRYDSQNPDANYCAVNAGQLKNVASLFFERLHGVGLSNPERLNFNGIDLESGEGGGVYPWKGGESENYSVVNVAQLKYLFSWEVLFPRANNYNSGGFPQNWYENYNFDYANPKLQKRLLRLEAATPTNSVCSLNESVAIKVKVKDSEGNAVSGVPVAFELNSSEGGSSVSSANSVSDGSGESASTFTNGEADRYAVKAYIVNNPSACQIFTFERAASADSEPTLSVSAISKKTTNPYIYNPSDYLVPSVRDVVLFDVNEYYAVRNISYFYQWTDAILNTVYEDFYENGGNYRLSDINPYLNCSSGYNPEGNDGVNAGSYCEGLEITINEILYLGNYKREDIEIKYEVNRNGVKTMENSMPAISGAGGRHIPTFTSGGSSWSNTISACNKFGLWLGNMRISEYNNSKTIEFDSLHTRIFRVSGDFSSYDVSAIGFLIYDAKTSTWKSDISDVSSVELFIKPQNLTAESFGTLSFTDIKYNLSESDTHTFSPVTWNLHYQPNMAFPVSESSGARYRKVSLLGMPLCDAKPQSESESDFAPPETYVDALTLNLRSDFVDYDLKIPNSDLRISVRRNYAPQPWTLLRGLRPHERLDLPFGESWASNLSSRVLIERHNRMNNYDAPDTATVVDENGMAYTFAIVWKNGAAKFYPMPSDKSDAQAFLNTLAYDGEGRLVFKKRFGTKLTFDAGAVEKSVKENRFQYSPYPVSLKYHRLQRVEDSLGNAVVYAYTDAQNSDKPLIPSSVFYEKNPKLKIQIECDSQAQVSKIYCPHGLVLEYSYSDFSYPLNGDDFADYESVTVESDMKIRALKEVKKCGSKIYGYEYGSGENPVACERDIWYALSGGEEFSRYHYFHLNLCKISDAVGNEYRFEYAPFAANYLKTGASEAETESENAIGGIFSKRRGKYYVPSGAVRKVSKVSVYDPLDGSLRTSAFKNDTFVVFDTQLSNGKYALNGAHKNRTKRATEITSSDGNKIRYSWAHSDDTGGNYGIVAYPVDSFRDAYGFGPNELFHNPIMVYYPKMKIEYFGKGGGTSAQFYEEFEFDIGAGMALKSVRDIFGNLTTFEYGDEMDIFDASERKFYYNAQKNSDGTFANPRYSDPTKQTDALGNTTEFAYNPQSRLMSSVKRGKSGSDAAERETRWTFSDDGYLRLKEEVFDASGNLAKCTLNEYSNPDFPAFLTKSISKDAAGAGKDVVTEYSPDEYGFTAETTTAAGRVSAVRNANGRIVSSTDANGNTTRFKFNEKNLLVETLYADGSSRKYEYDGVGRKISSTNENGVNTLYEYNALHLPTKVRRQSGEETYYTTSTSYNSAGLPSVVTDANGNRAETLYDFLWRPVSVKYYDAEGVLKSESLMEYGANCGSSHFDESKGFAPTKITSGTGIVTRIEYDALYRKVRESVNYATDADGNALESVTLVEYDIFGNVVKSTDPLGNSTFSEYNALDKPVKITNADSTVKMFSYTADGKTLSETDETGNTVRFEYDLAGRLSKKIFPTAYDFDIGGHAISSISYEYDANGNLVRETNGRGFNTDSVYDQRNRLVMSIKPALPDGNSQSGLYLRPVTTVKYDAVGNKLEETDANGNIYVNEYDMLNRLTKRIYPAVALDGVDVSLFELYSYDGNGNRISVTDRRGVVTVTEYNWQNKPVKSIRNFGGAKTITERSEYDADGRLTDIYDGNNNRTRYTYDGLNRKTRIEYGVGGNAQRERTFRYDAMNLLEDIGAVYEYDSMNRLVRKSDKTSADGESYKYAYDACGRILSVNDVSYEYDRRGNLISETNGGYRHYYKYDACGNRRSANYCAVKTDGSPSDSNNFGTTMSYDTNNRLISILDDKARLTAYRYDMNGNVLEISFSNGLNITKTYDAQNRLLSIMDANYFDLYTYDEVGNMKTVSGQTGDVGEHIFTYDAFNRLTHQLTCDVNVLSDTHYTYDDASNRIGKSYIGSGLYDYTKSPMTEEITYTVNSLNQTTGYTRIFNYENRGEEVTTKTMTYNAYGAMTSFGEDTYSYDGFGRLTEHRIGTNVRQYKYDYRNRLKEIWKDSYGGKISKATTPIYSGGLSVVDGSKLYRGVDMGGGVGGLLYEDRLNGDVSFKTSNIRGDIMTNINETRSTADGPNDTMTTETIDYGTFGEGNRYNGNYDENYRANSKREDMGLINDGHRWRNANLNMFLVPDPLEYPDGLNTYIYCNQNPWTRFDPTGLDTFELNRKLGGDSPRSDNNPLSHTFLYTTNPDGSLKHTYSWGNDYDENGKGLWFIDHENDISAAKKAIKANEKYNKASKFGKIFLSNYKDKKGDSKLDEFIHKIVKEKQSDPDDDSKHEWRITNQCKIESRKLLERAKERLENTIKNQEKNKNNDTTNVTNKKLKKENKNVGISDISPIYNVCYIYLLC